MKLIHKEVMIEKSFGDYESQVNERSIKDICSSLGRNIIYNRKIKVF
jgi:hypothetical protein